MKKWTSETRQLIHAWFLTQVTRVTLQSQLIARWTLKQFRVLSYWHFCAFRFCEIPIVCGEHHIAFGAGPNFIWKLLASNVLSLSLVFYWISRARAKKSPSNVGENEYPSKAYKIVARRKIERLGYSSGWGRTNKKEAERKNNKAAIKSYRTAPRDVRRYHLRGLHASPALIPLPRYDSPLFRGFK